MEDDERVSLMLDAGDLVASTSMRSRCDDDFEQHDDDDVDLHSERGDSRPRWFSTGFGATGTARDDDCEATRVGASRRSRRRAGWLDGRTRDALGALGALACVAGAAVSLSHASTRGRGGVPERSALGQAKKRFNTPRLGDGAASAAQKAVSHTVPYSPRFASIGPWPQRLWVPLDPKLRKEHYAELTAEKPDQEGINSFMDRWSSTIGANGPYTLPAHGTNTSTPMRNSSPLFYNFVHVPKAGGTFFSGFLMEAMEKVGERHGYAYPLNKAPFDSWITLPLVDLTQTNALELRRAFQTQEPAEFFSTEYLKKQYEQGKRYFGKGQYGMGLCEAMDAPCVYLTTLREPVSRYLSHYVYSCLLGGEGRAQWTEEWKEAGECKANPSEFMDHLGVNLDWLIELAPGKGSEQARVAAAKANLASACTRYILNEKYDDGIKRLRQTFPDFAGLGYSPFLNKNKAEPLSKHLKERYDAYLKDDKIMRDVKERHAAMIDVYNFAVKNYDASWSSPVKSC